MQFDAIIPIILLVYLGGIMQRKDLDENGKCIHDGHRKRLTDTVTKVGLDNLSKIQALEYILFLIFPRGDVNPLAHRLLDRFNNTATVLEASIEDLMEVKGIGEMAAQKIHSLLEMFYYYSFEKLNSEPIKTMGNLYDYIEQLLRYRAEEELYLLGVNSAGEIMEGRRFGKGSLDKVGVDLRDITLFISTYKVPAVYIVHNHPGGNCMPSKQDRTTFEKIKEIFSLYNCTLKDSLIIGKDGIYSMDKNSIQRLFSEGKEYLQSLFQEDLQ